MGAKIEISSKKRVPGRISRNGFVQSIPGSLKKKLIQRTHNSKTTFEFFLRSLATTVFGFVLWSPTSIQTFQ